MSKDYYNILGVAKGASQDEIKSAFRRKAHEHHPDKGGDAEKFKELNEAYQVLGNPQKRKQYDQFGSAYQNGQAGGFSGWQNAGGFSGGGFNMDFEDLGDMFGGFSDIFGFGGGRDNRRQTRGRDLEMSISLEFKEAVFGAEKEVSFAKNVSCKRCQASGAEPGSKIENCQTCGGSGRVSRVQRTILGNIQTQSTCPDCNGEGKIFTKKCTKCSGAGLERDNVKLKVKIPAGIDDGESIRLSGQGEAGQKGAPAGDLYLRIRIKAHPSLKREGYDIRSEQTISVKQAALGDKLEVETVDGPLTLKIPEGTQSGTIFKLKEKGITRLRGRGRGDHFVKVVVRIPSGLSRQQKKLLEDLEI